VKSARDMPEAIQWHEGMMLAPQHFQQQTQRMEQLMLYHVMAAAPFHWGILHLNIDRALLMSGVFRVLEIDAIMPDGLVVHHSSGQGSELDLDIAPFADTIGQTPLTVHIAAPAAKVGTGAVPGELARYESVEGPPVLDENGGDGEVRIPRLRPRLSLLATTGSGQKPPQKFVTFPLAQVVYHNEAYALTGFIPPTLRVGQHSALGRLCGDIARRAREKALLLSERTGMPSSSGNQLVLQETIAEIRALVTGLPPLEALIATNAAHPFNLYLALCGVVGHMAAFAAGGTPPLLSRYDHDNIEATFAEIVSFTQRMLDRVKDSFVAIPFQFDSGKFSLAMQEPWLKRDLVIGVRGSPSMSESDIAAWVEGSLIASRKRVEMLWEMRVTGAPRRVIEADESLQIVPGRGVVLVSIDNDPNYILVGDSLEIWNSDERGARYRPSEIVFYAPAQDGRG
jgi:type VI secretion system protein ImpJ